MRIDLLTANDPRTTVAMPIRSMWRVGAILEAVAVRDVTSGQLWLQLDNQRLPARLASGHTTGPLDGEHLKLRVLRDTPVLALESVEEGNSDHVTEDALRKFLPRQTSPTPLLANLGWLARNEQQLQTLPRNVQAALANLWQALPDAATLHDPEQLNAALLYSGTFLESLLGKQNLPASKTIAQDFKARLLALMEQLRGLGGISSSNHQPPGIMPNLHAPLIAMATGPASLAVLDEPAQQLAELKQQIAGLLARINTNQLLNAEAAQNGQLSWLIELPVKHDDQTQLLRFKFEREPRPHGSGDSAWTVEVAMDMGEQGPLHVQVSLVGKRINVQMRAESPTLVNALNQQLQSLQQGLSAAGLETDRLICLHGHPVDSAGSRLTRLLDLHA